jgi:FTR1 family protein
MLTTFAIGLREGLEAALILGIIAAFLRQRGRPDLLRWVYLGVGTAVLLCAAGAAAVTALSMSLSSWQRECLRAVVGMLAAAMVTYLVIWLRRNAHRFKGQLEGVAADAVGKGGHRANRALVGLAFLAVLREGFETVLFLTAAFDNSNDDFAAGAGAALGLLAAAGLGWLVYRGGVRLDLSRFFHATGLILVFVAAGFGVNALHAAQLAGWLDSGQQNTIDLTWLIHPGSIQASLLTGVFGIQGRPAPIELIGWLGYLIPVGLYVAWPLRQRTATRTRPADRLADELAAALAHRPPSTVPPLARTRPASLAEVLAGVAGVQDLREFNLRGADLTGAALAGADLRDLDLRAANLIGADLTSVHLTIALLSGANLTGADLSGAVLPVANLTGANLTGAILTGADLTGADLTVADLTGADLAIAELVRASLFHAKLLRARLCGADLTVANLIGADLTGADLTGANLTGANLTGANLSRAVLTETDLTRTVLAGADLRTAQLPTVEVMFGVFWTSDTRWGPLARSVLDRSVPAEDGYLLNPSGTELTRRH